MHNNEVLETNPYYRYHSLWLMIAYTLVLLVVYYSVISHTPNPSGIAKYFDQGAAKLYLGKRATLWMYYDTYMHLFTYFIIMMWFAQLYHVKRQRILTALIFICMGIVLELIQSIEATRQFELSDMAANFTGVLIAFVITGVAGCRSLLLKFESYL